MFHLAPPQKEELVPLLVSVGCLTGDTVSSLQKSAPFPSSSSLSSLVSSPHSIRSQSRSPASSTSIRRRSVPRPQELPCCSASTRTTPPPRGGRESIQSAELAGSPTSFCMTPTPDDCDSISEELQRYIDGRFDASSSLKGDEALAITHQLKEIHRCRYN